MLIGLAKFGQAWDATWVSTHPGMLVTDLHRNQGWGLVRRGDRLVWLHHASCHVFPWTLNAQHQLGLALRRQAEAPHRTNHRSRDAHA